MMIDDAQLLSFVIGIVLPVLVGAVTRYAASGTTAVLTEWGRAVASGDAFVWQAAAFAAGHVHRGRVDALRSVEANRCFGGGQAPARRFSAVVMQ